MSTIFSKIISREVSADIVYEDDKVLAFLDIRPVRKGHTLIIPKIEFVNIFDGDPEYLGHMMVVAHKIAPAIMKATGATGVNLHMNNGEAAGQDVMHAHLHIIPRFRRDEAFVILEHEKFTGDESPQLAEKIKSAIA